MSGFDDHDAIMEDWLTPQGTFFSSMTSDAIEARPVMGFDSEKYGAPLNSNQNGSTLSSARANNEASNSGGPKSTSRGGLAERVAARAGFNVPMLDTESIVRPLELYTKQDVQSPYLTIPPGLSPTALLESPVFLSNSLAEPSPTTGKFHFVSSENNPDPVLMTENRDKGKENTFDNMDPENTFENMNASSYAFNNASESDALAHFNASNNSFPSVDVTDHSEQQSTDTLKFHSDNNDMLFQQENFSGSHAEDNTGGNLVSDETYFSVGVTKNYSPFDEQPENRDQRSSEQDPNNVVGRAPAEDGYHWRKYGQKHVKGSEYPRSYHKCTHLNCPVKKKVERSQEGHITEIIYKGAHNHPKPQLNRRSTFGSLGALGDMQTDSEQHGSCVTSDLIWSVMQGGNNLEYSNGTATNLPAHSGSQSGDPMEESLTLSNYEDNDHATLGSVTLGNDIEVDGSESKKRRIETYLPGMSGATRAVREPRVVVQTTSEVDILDDGYRWRKYGQKVVKGNPNPRSYYKCTSPGCNVRKHVERAAQDLKSVLTTYEGKHNHEVPAARNSGNANSGGPTTQQVPVTTNIHRHEPCPIRGRSAWYERPQLNSFGLPALPLVSPGFGFGMNHPGSTSLGSAGFGPQYGPFSGNQSQSVNEMGYMLPKDEFKLEPVMDSSLNSAVGSSYYQQLMGRMPLGPQM